MPERKRCRLIFLCHHRWSLRVLAELYVGRGAKFVTLAHRLGVSRDSLLRTLAALIEHGLLKRNPGYGHPLRPEYVLTPTGARLAPWCHRLVRALRALRLEPSVLRKWSLPVLAVLQAGRARFSDLKSSLPGVTARALALTLKDMESTGLIQRRVLTEYPPATCYQLTARSRTLRAPLRHLGTSS
jgi:DNA-binding HxlR family transcriptional regulator